LGFSPGTAGDMNGDGFSREGRAHAYTGTANGLGAKPAWVAESSQGWSDFDNRVSTAGDINGDGYADVMVGALLYDAGETDEGGVFLYYGSANSPSLTPGWTAESDQTGGRLYLLSTAGDVNGDGYADVVVGADQCDAGEGDEGKVWLHYGSGAGLSPSPAWEAEGNQTDACFGCAVSTAGDLNGDGYADVIVGARDYDDGETDEGHAFVYYGSAGGGLSLRPRQLGIDGSTPIAPLGLSDAIDGVQLAWW
jgi:hypothetical protein